MRVKPLLIASLLLIAAPCGGAAEFDGSSPARPGIADHQGKSAALHPTRAEAPRVVFMGDSITEDWAKSASSIFTRQGFVNRGISGQTTPQMLKRFRADVIDLKPKAVVILAGTNDIAGNSGPATQDMIAGNIASMAELARAHGIRVLLASVPPAASFPWAPGVRPAERIVALNRWIRRYAARNQFAYLDYHGAMVDSRMGMRKEYSDDGVHPNAAGYLVMNRIALRALAM